MVIKKGFPCISIFQESEEGGVGVGGGALIHEKHLFDITTWGGQ